LVRGFTALFESNLPAAVISALDAWFDGIAGPVHAFGGEVLKFIGDGVLAIFPVVGGAPARLPCVRSPPRGPEWRISMMRGVSRGRSPLPFGAALHLGEMLWGNIGAADRLDFTAIGPAVKLVSWPEGLCRTLDKPVLVSGTLAAETTTPLVPLGEHALRGIVAPCTVFTLPDA
jgi:adenylate cyclase